MGLDREFLTGGLSGEDKGTLREIIDTLRETYCGTIVVEQIEFHISGCQIKLEFEHNTDEAIITLSGDGRVDFTGGGRFHGFIDPNSAGGTGDIVATTLNTDAGDTAHIVLYLRKKD